MITFFTIPKPFAGHVGMIQLNAVRTWTRLGDVLLFGDEDGIEAAATATGARFVPQIERNEYGTPLLSDAFAQAERLSDARVLCFVNSDILLFDDLPAAVARLTAPFLLVGESWNAEVTAPIDVTATGWETRVRELPQRKRGADAIDYFAYSRGLYEAMPTFAIGRTAFDNWLIWRARAQGATVADGTSVVRTIHQAHDYAHGGSLGAIRVSPEAQRNRELAGGKARLYSRFDATTRLTRYGAVPNPLRLGRVGEKGRRALYKLRHHVLHRPTE